MFPNYSGNKIFYQKIIKARGAHPSLPTNPLDPAETRPEGQLCMKVSTRGGPLTTPLPADGIFTRRNFFSDTDSAFFNERETQPATIHFHVPPWLSAHCTLRVADTYRADVCAASWAWEERCGSEKGLVRRQWRAGDHPWPISTSPLDCTLF